VRQDAIVTSGPSTRERPDRSMSLLVDMMTNTLDESYAEAARRRVGTAAEPGTAPPVRPGPGHRATAVLLLVALGVVTGIAAAQVRKREAAGSRLRADLVAEVGKRTSETDALAGEAARLRREVAAKQTAALQTNAFGSAVARQLAALQLAVGVDPVTGPGIVVRLEDPPSAPEENGDRGGRPGEGRVTDRDLQDAVNGLWASGAEAVAINGLRLSTLTAIRSAGESILVDYRPLSPPYTIRAIGDPAALQAGFAESADGKRLATLASVYGRRMVVKAADEQTLAGAGAQTLRLAVASEARS
jgi:uncharacterized protein YlxW (UPF0749 family)